MSEHDAMGGFDALDELLRESPERDAAALNRAAAAVLLAVTRIEAMPERLKDSILDRAAASRQG